MPRDIPIGNGNMLVAFDHKYQLRELFFPYVGQENHTQGHPSRFGVWADGVLSWIDDDSAWERHLEYEPDTLVTEVSLVNKRLGLALLCHDCVDISDDILVRSIEIENLREGTRDVRLFFHHDLHIGGSSDGDTAYYLPGNERALIHYKGRHWFLIDAMAGGQWGITSWATGMAGHHGSEGTWRDAEDGELGRNAIAQGAVDSTAAVHVKLDKTAQVYYWMCMGRSREEIVRLNKTVRERGPAALQDRVRAYWRQWVDHDHAHPGLPDDLAAFYRRSLLIVRTQIDNHGAILAANDSDSLDYSRDSYSYLWPRDGALVAQALDLAGYSDITRRFFQFCTGLLTPEGYFMHKYNPDGSTGSSWHPWIGPDGAEQIPIQEDETALILYALWHRYAEQKDIDFIRTLYAPLIERAGDFLWGFRGVMRDLPEPSWDLWEERRGIHLFTVASVWAGLRAAANFAEVFGDTERMLRYRDTADAMKRAVEKRFYNEDLGRFVRALVEVNGHWAQDPVLDSSQAGVFLFGMFEADDPRVVATMNAIQEQLWCRTNVGGVARYENDPYYRVTEDTRQVPGNPWFLSTLWVAQWYIAIARTTEDLQYPLRLLRWTAEHAYPSGVLAEQIHPYSGAPISVSPLTWSHATFVTTVCQWEECCRHLTEKVAEPRLTNGAAAL